MTSGKKAFIVLLAMAVALPFCGVKWDRLKGHWLEFSAKHTRIMPRSD